MPDRLGVVSELWRYPVKSFRGERLQAITLDGRGFAGDRAFAVRDANGKFGSGKTTRRFRLLRDLFDFAAETVDGEVLVHARDGRSFPAGDPALDDLLSERYGEPVAVRAEGDVSHFDAGAVHLLTTSSLEWVQASLGPGTGDARRYRPNIVLETSAEGPVEEQWLGSTLAIGTCTLRVTGTTERCVMPTFAQEGLAHEPRILRFLVEQNETMLGVYAELVIPGTIRLGDYALSSAGSP